MPSKFDIHNPPTAATCTDDAVNICDLIAVFDSLNRKIDKLTERINQLEAANCPILGTVNVSDTTFGSATLSATIGNYDPLTVKQFGFLISTVPINGYESAIAHSVATQSAGVFTMNIAGLQPNTTYYVKPYVLNDTVRCTQDTMVGMQNTWTTDKFVVTLSETSICLGESVTVSATSTTIPNIGTVSYTWSTGADVPSITATPDKIGDTTFTVSATYGGYTATASATVTVKPMPDATITSAPDPAYYEGSIPVQLTVAETAAGATFAWDTVPANALLMSTDRSIYVQPEAPTDYKVVVTLDGCVSESTITVMTRQCPTLTMVTTTEGSTIPTRTTFSSAITNFTGTIQDLGFLLTLDESWTGVVDTLRLTGVSFPLNVGPTDFPFSKDTVLTSGLLYHVRAFATTDPSICPVGYVDGEAVPYKVEAPSPISLTGNDSICGGEEITLTAPDGYNSYSWSNGKNTQSITVKPYGTTVYTVTADGTAFSRAVTVLQPVTIYGNPGNNANELVFDVRKVPGAHYEWKLGNNVIPNSDTNVVTVSADVTGSPKCYVTVTLGHCSVSDSAKVATVVNARDLCGITTVTDHEGNRYNVVAFENTYNFIDNAHNNDLLQCWTKENMRAVTSPSTGTYLVREVGRDEPVSWTGKIAAWPANDSLHYAPMNYGVLYNWNAALDLYHRGYGELSVNSGAIRKFNFLQDFPRGICPLGWHVARSSEWTAVEAPLANRTFDQLEAISGPRSVNYLGNKMASGIWSSSVSSCKTGDNNCSYRNVSDLSVLPAGTNNDVYVSSWAYFWTSESSYWYYNNTRYDTYASYLQFNGSDGGPTHSYENKQINMSARCVRDYDNSYTSAGRALYYYGYNLTSLTVGFETNPSAHVARRGVIYSTNASSALEIADPSATTLESTDGATVTEDTTNPDADKIFEKLINYSDPTYLRVFLIFDDGSVAYGQRTKM